MTHLKMPIIAIALEALIVATASADTRLVLPAANPSGNFFSNFAHIEIYGEIKAADIQSVSKQIKLMQSESYQRSNNLDESSMQQLKVSLDSQGGDLLAAMEIGRLLRKSNAWTVVSVGAECSSACIFILASGVTRSVQGSSVRLGLHRPRFDQKMFSNLDATKAKALYNRLIERCRVYLREMGISDRLLEDMLRIESNKVAYQDREYAENLLLVGDDPAFQEWARAKLIKEQGGDAVHAMDLFVECMNAGIQSEEECKRRYQETVERIDEEKMKRVQEMIRRMKAENAKVRP